ncbi:2,3-bisphosphoglycerate-independent phosphoglycerate mutase [Candidatus Parcubacteria bacterium]|nr:2,3-bisphosphoglycerate-independent phosphoglycerate mutase [Candidatus Parcubacteria bacterium]
MKKKVAKRIPVVLVILDGWGEWGNTVGNAVAHANTPTIDRLNKNYPKLLLNASGPAVGLPWGVYGNSEVGHQTIGSGQIIFQYLPVINSSIQDHEFEEKELLIETFNYLKNNKRALHLWGLCSDGGVHAHIDHLFAILDIAKKRGLVDVFIHVVTDGRDTRPKDAVKFVEQLQRKIKEIKIGKIATVSGRYFSMDRNNNWDRIEKAYKAMIKCEGRKAQDPLHAINMQYKKGKGDEYLEPTVIVDENNMPVGKINNNDTIFCFNYRRDRSRQMTRVFTETGFNRFNLIDEVNINYVCMTEYEEGLSENILFGPQKITTRIGEILSQNNYKQLRIAETEKFAHVTYFFNGGKSQPFLDEDRIFIPSKNCESYAEIPEMSAFEITEKLIKVVKKGKHDFILVNYANSDMVGHTGILSAGIKACEVVDKCLEQLIEVVLKKDGCLIITADHGNIEEMIKMETGEVDTEHSINPVPCWFVAQDAKQNPLSSKALSSDYVIADIAPTILELFNIKSPKEMNGESFLDFLYGRK